MQEDLEVTGVSRSGRVRKKSSKLMDFESPDDIEPRFRKSSMKTYSGARHEEQPVMEYQEPPQPQRPPDDAGTASGSESDYYENNADNGESMESDSSLSDENSARTPANSLYMMEKSKKKLIIKDGRVVGRAKAQRKDKGKTRITAYMMWAKEARNELLRKHPDMDFSAISKRLGEMWANVNYNERYLWKRKAKRFAMQKEQSNQSTVSKIISNQTPVRQSVHAGPGRPPKNKPPVTPPQPAVANAAAAAASATGAGGYRAGGCGAVELAAHLRLLGESLAIIGERLKEHEGQIAVSGSVSVLLDTLLCSLAPLLGVARAIPNIGPPTRLLQETLHNIAYIMPGL
ncbi:HMG box-containing protein 4 isoform X2 [Aricia agestis]|uniref:HMG box-containing protein 4 isoform X2 n=1 Tax=Aricia agestis TaxID=91739 RepID=UPI001C209457|nr:HMG box-containing protein 4 isoform X2 [Aricia agestis]